MAKWEELNMADRAAYMKIAVKNGYRDIRSIREAYNKYENGGNKKQSNPTDFRRVRENDTLATKKESTAMEDDINRRQKNMYYTAKNKGYDSKDYYIPYIPEKEIKVPGIGRVSSNMLDSIAVNAERAGISLVDAIGLAARETKFGAIPNYSLKARKDAYFKKHGKEMPKDVIKATERTALNSSVARNFGGIHPQFLINDHEWFQRGWGIKSLDKVASPLEHGFRLFKLGKYNTGEPEHTEEVRKAGNAAFNTPAIQNWYKEYKSKSKKRSGK